MQSPFLQVEKIDGPLRLMKIHFVKDAPAGELFADLQAFLERAFSLGCRHYVMDMRELAYPSTNLIALLISASARARQHQGEVILENVSHTARDNFLTFSALNYLTISPEEVSLSEMLASVPGAVSQSEEIDLDATALVEIAEPPVVRQLDKTLHTESVKDFYAFSKETEEAQIKSHLYRVESKAANLYQVCDFVVEHARLAGMKDKEIGKIRIAVYEACLNVIEHAYHSKPDNWIDLTVHYTRERYVMVIGDRGLSFEMKTQKEFDVQEAVESRRTGGFGMHIIRRAVDRVEYYPDTVRGNRLVLIKNLQ
jgi:anti-sigma regulatory factor (Ser/Thr protein kinase)/anti-anti-sigma regulatory factor